MCIYTIRIKAFSIPYNIRITISDSTFPLSRYRERERDTERDRRSFACLFRTQMSVFSMLVIKVISSDLSWGHQVTGHWLAVCLLNTVIWRSVYRMSRERCLCFYCQLDSTNQSEELSAWLSQSGGRTVLWRASGQRAVTAKHSVHCRRFERCNCWCYPKPPANRQTHGRVCEEVSLRDAHSSRQERENLHF